MFTDDIILDGDLCTFMEFGVDHKLQTSVAGKNAIPGIS